MTPLFRMLVFALCAGAGFLGARPFTASGSRGAASTPLPVAAPTVSIGLPPLTAAESAFIGEWEQLRAQHGGAGADLSALYADVKEIKDPFRRRAFRAALIAEWTATDPKAALAYLSAKDSGSVGQFVREWLRLDPQAAISGMLASDDKARLALRGVLSEIANVAPARLAEVVSALPKSDSRWDTTAQDAFAIFAQKDPAAARAAAESINGPLRGQALAGVAKSWAEKDGPAALVWAQALPPGETRDATLKALLAGWAKTDPIAALNKIDIVPPGGDEMSFASDVGAQVLREAATRDWDTTLTWLRDHPGKLGSSSLNGLMGVLSHRLEVNTADTMRSLLQSGLPGLSQVLGNSVLNEGYAQKEAIWQWLDRQPPGDFTKGVRGSLLNAMAWKDPDVALTYLDKIPNTPENLQLLQQGVSSLLNGGSQMDRFEDLLGKISPDLRPMLIQNGLMFGMNNGETFDPAKWLPRIDELGADQRPAAIGNLARSWGASDPEAAIAWATALTDPMQRNQTIGAAISGWARTDVYESTQWINTLPTGELRDIATQNLVGVLMNSAPEDAWTWALSIQAPGNRLSALQMAYMGLTQKNPTLAKQLLEEAHLPAIDVMALQKQFGR